jgi:hypothetical protein
MSKMNSLLSERLKQKPSKMTELATRSSDGHLSSFSGIFKVTELSSNEKDHLQTLLDTYKEQNQEIEGDLKMLFSITSEVKAINNQAAMLHGERIKKAQEVLKKYKEGAFSAWLVLTYGNRQTPYNFLQYFDLHQQLPSSLHTKLDEMPRQAVYTLASRNAPFEQKEEVIKNYQGQPKQELLTLIRTLFPLDGADKRLADLSAQAIKDLKRVLGLFKHHRFSPNSKQKLETERLLKELLKELS